MQKSKLFALAVGLFSLGWLGCSLEIQKIFAMKEGTSLDLAISCLDKTCDVPMGGMGLEGAAVMNIAMSTTLLDYLDGTVEGDIELVDVLFAVPGIKMFGYIDMGLTCVVLDDPPGGGTFAYDTLGQAATFDAVINTKAVLTNEQFAKIIVGGALPFPFAMQSTFPLPLVDGLGLFTGVSQVEVTQPVDSYMTITWVTGGYFYVHATGSVTLQTTDTFPVTPNITQCLDFLSTQGV